MNKEYYMRAVRAEVGKEELDEILQSVYGNIGRLEWDFYYPDIYIDVCMKRLNGEIDCAYFKTWLIVICNLLCVDETHYDISDFIDAWSFADEYDQRTCKAIIAEIRDYDLKFRHNDFVGYHKRKKMKVVYLRFEMIDHSTDSIIYKCYVVDYKNETFDLKFVDERMLDFDLEKNYCYIRDEEHFQDIKRQEGDESIEVIDHTKPEKQYCEAEEELQTIFYRYGYKRDEQLKL